MNTEIINQEMIDKTVNETENQATTSRIVTKTIEEFVTEFNEVKQNENSDQITECVKGILGTNYVPFKHKEAVAMVMINKATHVDEKIEMIDSCTAYINYITAVLMMYTTLDMSKETSLDTYDTLKECGAIPIIFDVINKEEIMEFKMVWEMVLNDYKNKQESPKYFVATQLGRIAEFMKLSNNVSLEQIIGVLNNLEDGDSVDGQE